MLFYEASEDCTLTTAGELFGRSGYGIGMPKVQSNPFYEHPLYKDTSLLRTVWFVPGEIKPLYFLLIQPV